MGYFLLLLFLLFLIYFIFLPAFRLYSRVKKAQKAQQDFINQMFGMGKEQPDPETMRRDAADRQARRKGGWSSPARKRKKIDNDIAENIHFTEIKSETTVETSDDNGSSTTSFSSESQIEDISWEDIPQK